MTDAERTSAQAEEQEKATENGGFLSRIVGTAKHMVETVTETAKDVVEVVAERTPPVIASAASTARETASAVVDRVRDSGGQATEQEAHVPTVEQEAPQAEIQAIAVEQDTMPMEQEPLQANAQAVPAEQDAAQTPEPEAEPVAAAPEAEAESEAATPADETGVVATATAAVADVATSVSKRVSRVYGALVGAEQPSSTGTPPADQEGGASYQAPVDAAKGGRPRRFKDVQAGMQLQGKVTSIALYGIFVDVGVGRDGLVHISEMSDKRIESPTDLVQIGTAVDVWVKSVDADARRISLTMRDPNRARPERPERRAPRRREVDRERLAQMKIGDSVEGVISSLAPFGAFVDLGVGKDGLVHVSELAEGRVERPEDAVQVGERYTFKVLEVDPEGNRISLSLRRAQRVQRMNQLETGVTMDGTISGIAPFGAFVDIGVGRDGLVHVSEVSAERINSVEDVVKVGDKVQVKVIEVESNSKRISLTMRVDEPLPNDRERQAPRAGGGPSMGADAGSFNTSPPPAPYSSGPSFGGGSPSFDEGRAGPRREPRRSGGGPRDSREGGRQEAGRGESRGGGGAPRRDRPDRGPGTRAPGGRADAGRPGRREGQIFESSEEVYSFEDPEEETFTGDATLADLLSKFNSGKGMDSKKDQDDEDDEGKGDSRAEAIRRTLALRDEE